MQISPKDVGRRQFLFLGMTVLIGSLNYPLKSAARVLNTDSRKLKKGKVILLLTSRTGARGSVLRVFDWDSHEHEDVPIPLQNPHSALKSKIHPNEIFVFDFIGSCVKINLTTKEIIKKSSPNQDSFFSGHGVEDNSGELIYCTEIPRFAPPIACTVVRSAKTLEKIKQLPAALGGAHHIVRMPKSNIIACANEIMRKDGTPSTSGGITFWDLETKKIVKIIHFQNAITHVLPISSSEVIGVPLQMAEGETKKMNGDLRGLLLESGGKSQPPMPLVYASIDGKQKEFWVEAHKEDFKYNLGLARVPDKNMFLTGHISSNKVQLWRGLELVKKIDVFAPTFISVSHDASEFLVLSGGVVKLFSLDEMKEIKSFYPEYSAVGMSSYG